MPTAMPDEGPESVDEIFRRMTQDLHVDVAGISEVNVASLDDRELLNKFSATKQELYARKELINPTTETGRDLHATYHAALLELKKRKLL